MKRRTKMFDKEIDHYNVTIYDYVSSMGGYRLFKTIKCDTEEKAVETAKAYLTDKNIKYKAKIEQVCNLVNWWGNNI